MEKNIMIISTLLFILCLPLFSFSIMQPKWGNSDTWPKTIVISNNFYQCRYNIKSIKVSQMDGTVKSAYYYDYIELRQINRPNIIKMLVINECPIELREQVVSDILQVYKEMK